MAEPRGSSGGRALARVYLVSGDAEAARSLQRQLEASGHTVWAFATAGEALCAGEADPPGLFMLAGALLNGDALDLCRRLRSIPRLVKTPVIIVARCSEDERIAGLEAGADEYLAQPLGARELAARVKAVLRRYAPPKADEVIRVGALTIDRLAMRVESEGRPVALTTTEFRLLEHLARHRGRVVSREQLLAVVWRGAEDVSPRAIDVYVRRVRSKIEHDPETPAYLMTVRGAGYRFAGPGGSPSKQES